MKLNCKMIKMFQKPGEDKKDSPFDKFNFCSKGEIRNQSTNNKYFEKYTQIFAKCLNQADI